MKTKQLEAVLQRARTEVEEHVRLGHQAFLVSLQYVDVCGGLGSTFRSDIPRFFDATQQFLSGLGLNVHGVTHDEWSYTVHYECSSPARKEATKVCAACAETIKAAASVCRFCGAAQDDPRRVRAAAESGASARPAPPLASAPSPTGSEILVCAACGSRNKPNRATCFECSAPLPRHDSSKGVGIAAEASAAPDVLVCPGCGARNKPNRTSCFSCSSPLDDESLGNDSAFHETAVVYENLSGPAGQQARVVVDGPDELLSEIESRLRPWAMRSQHGRPFGPGFGLEQALSAIGQVTAPDWAFDAVTGRYADMLLQSFQDGGLTLEMYDSAIGIDGRGLAGAHVDRRTSRILIEAAEASKDVLVARAQVDLNRLAELKRADPAFRRSCAYHAIVRGRI